MSYQSAPDARYLDAVVGSGVGEVLLPDADPLRLAAETARHGLLDVPFVAHDARPDQVDAAVGAAGYVLLAAHSGVTGHRDTVEPG